MEPWEEVGNHLIKSVDRMEALLEKMVDDHQNLRVEIEKIKAISKFVNALFGAVAGLLASLIPSLWKIF